MDFILFVLIANKRKTNGYCLWHKVRSINYVVWSFFEINIQSEFVYRFHWGVQIFGRILIETLKNLNLMHLLDTLYVFLLSVFQKQVSINNREKKSQINYKKETQNFQFFTCFSEYSKFFQWSNKMCFLIGINYLWWKIYGWSCFKFMTVFFRWLCANKDIIFHSH